VGGSTEHRVGDVAVGHKRSREGARVHANGNGNGSSAPAATVATGVSTFRSTPVGEVDADADAVGRDGSGGGPRAKRPARQASDDGMPSATRQRSLSGGEGLEDSVALLDPALLAAGAGASGLDATAPQYPVASQQKRRGGASSALRQSGPPRKPKLPGPVAAEAAGDVTSSDDATGKSPLRFPT